MDINAVSVSYKGLRSANEDALDINLKSKNKFFAIYDGHGGANVSSYLKDEMPKHFINEDLPIKKPNVCKIFKQLQTNLIKSNKTVAEEMGSTCLCALVNDNKLQVMNVGDCRAVLANNKKAVVITSDHKPNTKVERERISKIKGNEKIYNDDGIWRIGPLSVSRAFGDTDTGKYISQTPDIFSYNISNKDDFLVLGCDGLWDVMKNNEVVKFVYDNPVNSARKLGSEALKKGSSDNISIIIVYFNHHNKLGGSKIKESKPSTVKPSATKSSTVKPSTVKPIAAKPIAAKPIAAKSSTVKPSTAKLGGSKSKSSTLKLSTVKSESIFNKIEPSRPLKPQSSRETPKTKSVKENKKSPNSKK